MPRPIWTGSIGFGLVNVPVRLVAATSPKEVHFHQLHDQDGGRINLKRVCSIEGAEVPYQHIVKGYEVRKGRYVAIAREELEALNPKATKTIEIEDFVGLEQIDPIYFEHTWYLLPDRGAAKPYGLLLEAMKQTGKVGVARMVMRTRQYLCAVRPLGQALVVSTMLYADEVIDQKQLDGLPEGGARPKERELKMAEQLIESLAGKFDPRKYRDEYRAQVLKLISRKAEGEEIAVEPAGKAAPASPLSLVEALTASLAGRKSADKQGGTKAASAAKQGGAKAIAAAEPAGRERRHRPHRAAGSRTGSKAARPARKTRKPRR